MWLTVDFPSQASRGGTVWRTREIDLSFFLRVCKVRKKTDSTLWESSNSLPEREIAYFPKWQTIPLRLYTFELLALSKFHRWFESFLQMGGCTDIRQGHTHSCGGGVVHYLDYRDNPFIIWQYVTWVCSDLNSEVIVCSGLFAQCSLCACLCLYAVFHTEIMVSLFLHM